MTDNERLQAAKAAFTLCQEDIARQYGVVAFANANTQQLQGNGGIQIQLNPFLDFAFVANWQPESTVGGKKEGGKDE